MSNNTSGTQRAAAALVHGCESISKRGGPGRSKSAAQSCARVAGRADCCQARRSPGTSAAPRTHRLEAARRAAARACTGRATK